VAVGVGRARDRVLSGVDGKTQNYKLQNYRLIIACWMSVCVPS
jgi:hypothetical protein